MKTAKVLQMESVLVPILPEKKAAKIQGGYYIKAKCIQNSAIASAPPHVREIWDWLIKEAEYKTKYLKGTTLSRGQLFTDYAEIQEGLSWKEGFIKKTYQKHHVDYAMRWLREKEMITTQKTTRGIIITVCNYEFYQNADNYKSDADSDKPTVTTPQQTPQTPVITTDEAIVTTLKPIVSEEKKANDYDSAKDTANDTASETIAKEVKEVNRESVGAEAPPTTPQPIKLEKKKSFKQYTETEFYNEVATFKDKYTRDILREFYDKWTEKNDKGKMKFQLEKTWETGKRLATWLRNEEKWNPKYKQTTTNPQKSTDNVLKEYQELQERNNAKYGRN